MLIILMTMVLLTTISAVRIILGPTYWDRLLGLNLVTTKLIMLIVLLATFRSSSFLLDIGLSYALLGFIGVTFISIMIQKRGRL